MPEAGIVFAPATAAWTPQMATTAVVVKPRAARRDVDIDERCLALSGASLAGWAIKPNKSLIACSEKGQRSLGNLKTIEMSLWG